MPQQQQQHQEHSKCAICCEARNEYETLSCLHQLCSTCYEKLVKNAIKAKNHVRCPFCRRVQYPCCKAYLLSSSARATSSPVSHASSVNHADSRAQEHIHLTIDNEQEKQPMFAKVVGFLVMCACIAITIYAIVNVTEKN